MQINKIFLERREQAKKEVMIIAVSYWVDTRCSGLGEAFLMYYM